MVTTWATGPAFPVGTGPLLAPDPKCYVRKYKSTYSPPKRAGGSLSSGDLIESIDRLRADGILDPAGAETGPDAEPTPSHRPIASREGRPVPRDTPDQLTGSEQATDPTDLLIRQPRNRWPMLHTTRLGIHNHRAADPQRGSWPGTGAGLQVSSSA